jgi:hypothetical protein
LSISAFSSEDAVAAVVAAVSVNACTESSAFSTLEFKAHDE